MDTGFDTQCRGRDRDRQAGCWVDVPAGLTDSLPTHACAHPLPLQADKVAQARDLEAKLHSHEPPTTLTMSTEELLRQQGSA